MRLFAATRAALGAACLIVLAAAANAQDRRAVQQLEEKGFVSCAKSASSVLEFLYEKNSFAFLNTWNQADPDKHAAAMRTTDGHTFASVITTPNAAGTCDAAFSQIFPASEPCPKILETTFKAWKRYGELAGIPVYVDPTTPSVTVILVQTSGTSCLIMKSGMLFM